MYPNDSSGTKFQSSKQKIAKAKLTQMNNLVQIPEGDYP